MGNGITRGSTFEVAFLALPAVVDVVVGPTGCLWRINTEADFQALQEKARSSQRSHWQ